MGRVITIKQAINEAHHEEFERDKSVIIMGCDVGIRGNPFGVTAGLYEKFGADRSFIHRLDHYPHGSDC